MWDTLKRFFSSPGNIAVLISAISTLIAAVSTVISIIANHRSQQQYKESVKPQLTMKLVDFNGFLYLQVKNTGKTVARNIDITPIKIENNGENNVSPNSCGIFSMPFELYPEEIVQSEVGTCFQTVAAAAFPQLFLSVEYSLDGTGKKVKYNRTVTYAPAYDSKVLVDIDKDNKNVESSLKTISRAAVRTANYLDGWQVADFDERSIISGKTLRNDLMNAAGKNEEHVMTRDEVLEETAKGADKNG